MLPSWMYSVKVSSLSDDATMLLYNYLRSTYNLSSSDAWARINDASRRGMTVSELLSTFTVGSGYIVTPGDTLSYISPIYTNPFYNLIYGIDSGAGLVAYPVVYTTPSGAVGTWLPSVTGYTSAPTGGTSPNGGAKDNTWMYVMVGVIAVAVIMFLVLRK